MMAFGPSNAKPYVLRVPDVGLMAGASMISLAMKMVVGLAQTVNG
jgi:hypothetical protein